MTVLVAYNETAQGELALHAALDECRRREEPLTVLVLTPQPDTAPTPPQLTALSESSDVDIQIMFRSNAIDVADAILDHAEQVHASMIVLGSRKRTPVGKFLLGSTTQRVLLDASVPVLVVKPPLEG
ncbi:universal stress protein [Timonella sp. A28]|uniref:universal stress protein n=1 Tax=Timonella sp. A28 TaxID=3442640 RepID=UPI003EBE6C48